MDEYKSRKYAELVERVKQKYRNHPVCTDKLELGWCDLLPGEDYVMKLIYGHIGKAGDMQRILHILNIC